MNLTIIAPWALVILLALCCAWLVNEFRKKFRFFSDWAEGGQKVTFHYPGPEEFGEKPAMRKIVLRSEDGTPFRALVCMEWHIAGKHWGLDPYGEVKSDPDGVAAIDTFFGFGPVDFVFVVNTPVRVVATSTEDDQSRAVSPSAVFPPHLVQKWGLYQG